MSSYRDLRALGVDLGTKRIGVALSNSAGTIATPYEVIQRCGNESADHRRLRALAEEADVSVVVVGMPFSLDGTMGPAAEAASAEVARLAVVLGVPVETVDERLTTVTAQQQLRAQGLSSAKQRQVIDKVAASVLLQAWLDRQRAMAGAPEEEGLAP